MRLPSIAPLCPATTVTAYPGAEKSRNMFPRTTQFVLLPLSIFTALAAPDEKLSCSITPFALQPILYAKHAAGTSSHLSTTRLFSIVPEVPVFPPFQLKTIAEQYPPAYEETSQSR